MVHPFLSRGAGAADIVEAKQTNSLRWSTLPRDILTAVARRLNSSVELLRLRAVCSSWRSSLPLPPKPFHSFLKLPFPNARYYDLNPNNRPGYLCLFQSTVYRLSPLASSKNGWLLKLSDTQKPNTFSLLNPLSTSKFKTTRPNFPKQINLLDYRISEICKSYTLKFVDQENPLEQTESVLIRRVAVLSDYTIDGDGVGDNFVVLLLRYGGDLEAWRFGEEKWTSIEGDDNRFDEVLCCGGKCYAIDYAGDLSVFDSGLNLIKRFSDRFVMCCQPRQRKILVEFNGYLYVFDKTSDLDAEFYYDHWEDEYVMNWKEYDMPLRLKIFKLNEKNGGGWDYVGSLGDGVFFLGDDVTFGIWKKDYGCKGDCIYLTDECFVQLEEGEFGEDTGVYDLNECKIVALAECPEYARVFWPPPSWFLDSASSG
ncbi:hypothetical protein Ancab_003104 [Ancistrocladus abbreviatus]